MRADKLIEELSKLPPETEVCLHHSRSHTKVHEIDWWPMQKIAVLYPNLGGGPHVSPPKTRQT